MRFFLFIFCLLCFAGITDNALAANIRLSSSTSMQSLPIGGKHITTLKKGSYVSAECRVWGDIHQRSVVWFRVKVGKRSGWIHRSSTRAFLPLCTQGANTVTVSSIGLAVRSRPALQSSVRLRLPNRSRVVASCVASGDAVNGDRRWLRIRYPSSAWVHSSYISGSLPAACPSSQVPTHSGMQGACNVTSFTSSSQSNQQFLDSSGPLARASYRTTGVFASVTLAQAILESNWGRNDIGVNNLFGIKAQTRATSVYYWGEYAAGCRIVSTKEQKSNGDFITVKAAFRAYSSRQGSFVDHGWFLRNNDRYAPAFTTSDPESFVRAVAKAGYATDKAYADKLIAIIRRYKLTVWDQA